MNTIIKITLNYCKYLRLSIRPYIGLSFWGKFLKTELNQTSWCGMCKHLLFIGAWSHLCVNKLCLLGQQINQSRRVTPKWTLDSLTLESQGSSIRAKLFNVQEIRLGQTIKIMNVETESWKGGAITVTSTDETRLEVYLCNSFVILFLVARTTFFTL